MNVMTRLVLHVAAVAVAATVAAACSTAEPIESGGDSATPAQPDAVPTAQQPETPPPTEPPTPTATPDSGASLDPETTNPSTTMWGEPAEAIEAHIGWFVEALNGESTPDEAELADRFAASFLEAVPAPAVLGVIGQIAAEAGPNLAIATVEFTSETGAVARIVNADGMAVIVTLEVEAGPPGRITGLLVEPGEPPEFPLDQTIDDLDSALIALAPRSSLGIYNVTDGRCGTVEELRPDEAMPIGSAFKLWVLTELGHQIRAGTIAWTDSVAVTDELRSSPDGNAFALQPGDEATVETLAEWMIAISDNTATDVLIDLVGRKAVESAMDRIGIGTPGRNVPLLSTGDLFYLKFVAEAPNADDYRALDVEGRRALLAELSERVLPWVDDPDALDLVNADGVAITEPRDLDLEWFATPHDLCLTMVHLAELAAAPGLEPVGRILEINAGAGLAFDRDRFPVIRFKGGSEPGVVAGVWWVERSDGERFVVAGALADERAPLPIDSVVVLASGITLVTGPS